MRIVIALGGNALLRRGDPMTIEVQRRNIKIAAEAIAPLAAGHSIVIVHGNGPQVGLLSLQAEAYNGAEPYPLDVLDAGTQGIIGYLIQEELRSLLPAGQQLAGARLGWATVGLVAWFGPRGLASVVFALLALEELGSPTADRAVAVASPSPSLCCSASSPTEPRLNRWPPGMRNCLPIASQRAPAPLEGDAPYQRRC